MKIEVRLQNIDKVEGLETKIREKIGRFVKHDRAAHLVMHVSKLSERTENRLPVFGCELVLKTSNPPNTLVAMKESENFYQAYDMAINALMKMLRRRSAKEIRHNRIAIKDFKEKMAHADYNTETQSA